MPHIHEKIDFCSEVFVVYKNTVLLRKHDKYKFWCSVGGHVELHEDPAEAAVREVQEEVGLTIDLYYKKEELPFTSGNNMSVIPPRFMHRHPVQGIHEHVVFIYFATTNSPDLRLSEKEKTDGCHWFTKKELEENEYQVPDFIRHYALQALYMLST